MKKLFTKAPLFVSICISMAAMFVLTQFIEPLQTYFPVFSDDVTQIKDSVVELANLIDATVINPRREENTLYVATPLDLNETIVPDTLQQSDDIGRHRHRINNSANRRQVNYNIIIVCLQSFKQLCHALGNQQLGRIGRRISAGNHIE